MRLDCLDPVAALVKQRWSDPNGYSEQLAWLPGETADAFGRTLAPGRWLSHAWEHLTQSLDDANWLEERYPEVLGEKEPRRSMAQFDMINCIWLGINGHRALAFYDLGSGAASEFARRLHHDAGYRARLASALDMTLEDFDAKAPEALRASRSFGWGRFEHSEVPSILETGSSR
jgi:hypothetical protein